MKYSIDRFFKPEDCKEIIEYVENKGAIFSYTKTLHWDCRRIDEPEFTSKILNRFNQLYEFDSNDINISLTKYYDGRWLDLHLDQSSQLTTVIVLSDNFYDGRFMLSDDPKLKNGASKAVPRLGSVPSSKVKTAKKIELQKGESISFNGSEIYHGVMPVTKGIRYALNIWMTNTNFRYIVPSKKTIL